MITNGGEAIPESGGGTTEFHDFSTAANATLICNSSVDESWQGSIQFSENSSAGNAGITIKGAASYFGLPGSLHFTGNSTAGNATITNEGLRDVYLGGGGYTEFLGNASAGNATIIAESGAVDYQGRILAGGEIHFSSSSTESTARIEVFVTGSLSCSEQTVGSMKEPESCLLAITSA